jgi:hypothetical protein
MSDSELEAFKSYIDLRSFAASQGYQLDLKESWRGSAVMRNASGDKIIIKRDIDGHFVYFSLRDDRDNGTIIDFAKRRLGLSIGGVRKELRPWLSMPSPPLPPYPPLQKTAKDRIRVEREYDRTQIALRHPYLERERCIPGELLESKRFAGRIRIDNRGNAIFPHFDNDGLSGFEIKNHGFTSFAPGGTKGMFISHSFPDDNRLVISESAIDALSHAALFPDERARYASISGKPNPQQRELIRAAAAVMPSASTIVAAMDADTEGRKLAEVVRDAVSLTGRHDLRFEVHQPQQGKDWNDVLKGRPNPPLPLRPETPSVV